jgi:hypothetical protein
MATERIRPGWLFAFLAAEMTSLSVIENGLPAIVVANPIFPLSTDQTRITFEILEDDAAALRRLVGRAAFYVIDGVSAAVRLKSLAACTSTHPGLALMREKPTLRGVLEKFDEPTVRTPI